MFVHCLYVQTESIMVTLRIILDKRRHSEDEECQLKLRITQNRKSVYISLGFALRQSNFNEETLKVTGVHNAKELTSLIEQRLIAARHLIIQLSNSGSLDSLSADEIKKRIEVEFGMVEEENTNNIGVTDFNSFFTAQIEKKKAKQTKALYSQTLKEINRFTGNNTLKFEDITKQWLEQFDSFLAIKSPSLNARAIHLRNIRAVFNAAIDDELTTYYPFRKFKIRTEATRKRSLTAETIRDIAFRKIDNENVAYARDMFLLSFLLIGINTIDLYNLKSIDSEGRISYKRAKTNRQYDIKVEHEALEIIKRHRGINTLVDLADRWKANYRHFTEKADTWLKELHSDISMYWARHSWATIAAELDIPLETISAALGHSMGNKVTSIYIDFNRKKIDEANRKVIDYVFNPHFS